MARFPKRLTTVLKILFSAILLYFVFTKIRISDILAILEKASPLFLLVALCFFMLSKIIAALRLNLYFHQVNIRLTQNSNLKLYLLGMFYNLFLPGGIGGDAYKGYVLKKKFEVKTRAVVGVLVLDRLSGLLLLFVYACLLALITAHPMLQSLKPFFILALPLAVAAFWYLNNRFFNIVMPIFWKSVVYSGLVQLAQLGAAFFILKALSVEGDTLLYLFIFLVSSIVAVLPVTLGGIGSREVVFYYGAIWLGLDENTSVGISMVFFMVTAFVSLWGLAYHFKKPPMQVKEGE